MPRIARCFARKTTEENREYEGICGIEGFELFSALHVDLSEYDREKYFEPELFGFGAFLIKKWRTTFKHPQTITVAQLVQAVDTGKWKE